MRIAEIHVDGFGLMLGRAVPLAPGLNIIRGENETGKSTLLAFVRAMLFGFERGRYRTLAGGRRGGWLDLVMDNGLPLRVERYGEAGGQGNLRILDSSNRDLGPGELPRLLQGVEQGLFNNIFAFGLDELAEFKRLSDREVAARIYGAGLGLGAVSALEVEDSIRAAADNLFKPAGKTPSINRLLRELEEADSQLRHLDLPGDYGRKQVRLAECEEALRGLGLEAAEFEAAKRDCDRIKGGWEDWLALLEASASREAIGEVRSFPPGTREMLIGLENKLGNASEAAAKAKQSLGEAQEDLAKIVVDEELLDGRTEVEDALRAAELDKARSKELTELGQQVRVARSEFDETLVRLGVGWDAGRVEAFDDSVRIQSDISGHFRELLSRAASELGRAESERDRLAKAVTDVADQTASIRAAIDQIAADQSGTPSVEEQERLMAALDRLLAEQSSMTTQLKKCQDEAKLVEPDSDFDADRTREKIRTARHLAALLDEQRSTGALIEALPPAGNAAQGWQRRALIVALAGLVLGAAAILAGSPVSVGLLIALVGVGLGAVLWRPQFPPMARGSETALGAKLRGLVEQAHHDATSAAADLDLDPHVGVEAVEAFMVSCDEQLARHAKVVELQKTIGGLEHELETVQGHLEEAVLQAGAVSASEDSLKALRTTLSAARDRRSRRIGLEGQLETHARQQVSLAKQAGEAETRVAQAKMAEASRRDEWHAWLQAHDLPVDIDCDTAKAIVDTVTTAKRPLRSRQSLQERERLLQQEHDAFVVSLDKLAGRFGVERTSDDADGTYARVRALKARLDATVGADSDRRSALRVVESSAREEKETADLLRSQQDAIDSLLKEVETPDVQTLRRTIEITEAAKTLDGQILASRRTLTALSGPGEALAALQDQMRSVEDIAEIDERLGKVEEHLAETRRRQNELTEEVGALRTSIEAMEHDVAATQTRQRRSDLQGQLEARAEQWAELTLALHILSEARQSYEATHRPDVIQQAEVFFKEWTDGRYERILAPLGGSIEEVEHRDGRRVPLSDLSKGTAEQLYLAIRFGLVGHFTQTAEPLPILMDDILVNFDDRRAALAARSIEQMAMKHQVIYFTCHPGTPLAGGQEVSLPALESVAQAQAVQ